MNQDTWALVLIVAFVALVLIRKGFFYTFIGPRNLRYDAFDELLQRGDGIELVAKEERGSTQQWQFRTREGSVMYFRTGDVTESLDVNVRGTVGLLLFFRNGKLEATLRAGTHNRREQPNLPSTSQSQIYALLLRARELADEHPFTQ